MKESSNYFVVGKNLYNKMKDTYLIKNINETKEEIKVEIVNYNQTLNGQIGYLVSIGKERSIVKLESEIIGGTGKRKMYTNYLISNDRIRVLNTK